ncbi:hypothetical protein Pan216_27860 [Planctomycetes bacterium Pan216]|uniref:Uncharacterized protein n=1 Tax=Kolteria novifilia TaxID=2527975 RepID=A0A518B4L5_9BACT|nr:hypothetical protein Pan216_27860 [Planctomycetes bacterium Pan216]
MAYWKGWHDAVRWMMMHRAAAAKKGSEGKSHDSKMGPGSKRGPGPMMGPGSRWGSRGPFSRRDDGKGESRRGPGFMGRRGGEDRKGGPPSWMRHRRGDHDHGKGKDDRKRGGRGDDDKRRRPRGFGEDNPFRSESDLVGKGEVKASEPKKDVADSQVPESKTGVVTKPAPESKTGVVTKPAPATKTGAKPAPELSKDEKRSKANEPIVSEPAKAEVAPAKPKSESPKLLDQKIRKGTKDAPTEKTNAGLFVQQGNFFVTSLSREFGSPEMSKRFTQAGRVSMLLLW